MNNVDGQLSAIWYNNGSYIIVNRIFDVMASVLASSAVLLLLR